mmetsp:Transcript_58702/g.188773  ORF Transcript_58702/g.188773 Transcript_58702/m.188773 type:complete len:411 (-) Transcript_58702:96-1328(-)
MDNPLLKKALTNFPDIDPASLPWPADAGSWELKDLELFIGSGGFLKPKRKKAEAKAAQPQPKVSEPAAAKAEPGAKPAEDGAKVANAKPSEAPVQPGGDPEDRPSAFEVPGFITERCAITMPVRVHCEDTTPYGHVRIESLTAFAERIRSLALKQLMNLSLADLKERKLAILATEYVCEIVGQGCRVLDTLRIEITPEFPAAPLFPWDTKMYAEDGTLYMHGWFGLNFCQISDSGAYSGIDEKGYREFTKNFLKWTNPKRSTFSPTNLRFFNAYKASGVPFRPTARREVTYVVRSTDCDMYNVLFQARVPSMMESCHPRQDALAFYVNIRMSVRPGDELAVHVFSEEDAALFICLRGKTSVLAAFGHYGRQRPMSQESIKCASVRLPTLLKFCSGGAKPEACEDFDLSAL